MTWLADIVLAVTVLEALFLLKFGARCNLPPRDAIAMLLPGMALVLALRFALAETRGLAIAAALLLALLAHGYDLFRRSRRRV